MGSYTLARSAVKGRSSSSEAVRPPGLAPLPVNPVWQRVAIEIQPKLALSAPNDRFEQEAERVSDHVMRMPEPWLQRACVDCETAPAPCPSCEEESRIQRKADVPGQGQVAPADLTAGLGAGRPLEPSVRSFFEPRFGQDFGAVRVHAGADADASARSVNALAYTLGRDVVFRSGQYAPHSESGRRLIAHELTHVVQQGGTARQVARQIYDRNPCPGYESGEVSRSRSAHGQLVHDVEMIAPGQLLVGDFPVDSSALRSEARDDPLLRQWLDTFEADDSYRLEIVGYSDCVGDESNNVDLRQARASRIEGLLGVQARPRLTFRGMAGLGTYVVPNDSADNRARNRGAVIEFRQEYVFEPDTITVTPKRCGPDSTGWLIDQMNRNRNHPVIKTAREVEWPRYVPFFNLGWTYGFLSDFKDLVKAGGPWDFKSNQSMWRSGAGKDCPTPPCDRTVVLCGRCFNYDVPGNIHYGWIGRQAGLRAWFLHNRADAAQAGGVDDPRDAVAIDIGIAMADDGATLCGELGTHGNELNLERTDGCALCPTAGS